MPTRSELPEDVRGLTDLNGHLLSDARWREDFARLDSFLERFGRQKVAKGRRMKLDGAEIVRRHRTGDGPPDFVGVAGGFPPKGKGARLQELIASQSWERRPFEVQYGGSRPEHANWGTVEDLSTLWARPRLRPNCPHLGPSFPLRRRRR